MLLSRSRVEIRSVICPCPCHCFPHYARSFATTKCRLQRLRQISSKRVKRILEASQKLFSSYAFQSFRAAQASQLRALLIFSFIIVPPPTERRGGISRGPRCSRRKGSQRVPGCSSVCIYLHNSRIPCTTRNNSCFFLTFSTSLSLPITHVPTAICDDFCRKYRYMDSNLTQRRRGLEEKIPDIKKTLKMVEFLRDRRVRDSDIHEGVWGDVRSVAPQTFSHSFLSDHLSDI